MRIGILSDTHLRDGDLPEAIVRAFQGVDLILHAGDIYTLALLDRLEEIAPVRAARGYPDPPQPDPRVAVAQVVEVSGLRIGLVHDLNWPGPKLLGNRGELMDFDDAALAAKFGARPDVVVFGDTHQQLCEIRNPKSENGAVLFINPGMAIPAPGGVGTIALLETGPGGIRVRTGQPGSLSQAW